MTAARILRRLCCASGLAATLVFAGCASRGPAVPQPFPTPGGRSAPSHRDAPAEGTPPSAVTLAPGVSLAEPSVLIQSLLSTALHFIGTPYRNGGAAPGGFDCSGFVYYVFAQQGVFVPRTVAHQAGAGQRVGDVRAGDLVFFKTGRRGPTHVGIALDGSRFVHAPSSRGEVRVEPLARRYWSERFLEARRLF